MVKPTSLPLFLRMERYTSEAKLWNIIYAFSVVRFVVISTLL